MSSHALLSPSSAERWLNCTPAPRLEELLPVSMSSYAEEGTLAHSVSELYARRKFSQLATRAFNASLKKLKEHELWHDEMLTTAEIYVEHLEERVMQFNSQPYITFESKVDISHYVPYAFGTCDCIMIGGDTLVITDYKHGKGVPVSAQDNPQIMLYALGALQAYRSIYGDQIKQVIMCVDQPRLNSYTTFTMSEADLITWGIEVVKPKAELADAGAGELNVGEWCRFCRVKTRCPARASHYTALSDFKDTTPSLLSSSDIGVLLQQGKGLVDWYNSLKDYALGAVLSGTVIQGWKAVEGRGSRTWVDQDKALETIIAAGLPREIIYDTVPKSLSQLEKILGVADFNELVGSLITKTAGKPTLVDCTDKRPEYSSAASDFKGIDGSGD